MVQEHEMKRFGFGENWKAFSETIDQERLDEAKKSLQYTFRLDDFTGRVFLDIGCGSGLFSLAATQLALGLHPLIMIQIQLHVLSTCVTFMESKNRIGLCIRVPFWMTL